MGVLLGTESTLHLEMKAAVSSRLSDTGFSVIVEPPFPPRRLLSWSSYRPDLLAVRHGESVLECCFVECETSPSCERILRKRTNSITRQSLLLEELRVSFLLVVPRGKLARVTSSALRRVWDVWTYEKQSGEIHEFPSLRRGGTEISAGLQGASHADGGCSSQGEPE